jgi:hypothetical protein
MPTITTKASFNKSRDSADGLVVYANKDKRESEEATHIRSILNDYELLAVGIKRGILDE